MVSRLRDRTLLRKRFDAPITTHSTAGAVPQVSWTLVSSTADTSTANMSDALPTNPGGLTEYTG